MFLSCSLAQRRIHDSCPAGLTLSMPTSLVLHALQLLPSTSGSDELPCQQGHWAVSSHQLPPICYIKSQTTANL